MILSHHGEMEFGSPKVPLFAEAMLLHHLDNLDSKMECMRAMVDKDRTSRRALDQIQLRAGSGGIEEGEVFGRASRHCSSPPPPVPIAVPASASNTAPPVTKPAPIAAESPAPVAVAVAASSSPAPRPVPQPRTSFFGDKLKQASGPVNSQSDKSGTLSGGLQRSERILNGGGCPRLNVLSTDLVESCQNCVGFR